MRDIDNMMKNIEYLGEKYCKRYLYIWDKEKLENNWWEALKFFFSHSFVRGRRDELSNEYYHFTVKVLEDYFGITDENLEESYRKLKECKNYFDKEPILRFKRDKNIGNSIEHEDFRREVAEKNPVVKLLTTRRIILVEWKGKTYFKEISLGNDEDVMMVLDVLRLVSDDEKKNIYNYLRNMIASQKVEFAYRELTEIRAIADKIATLIIRDICLLNPEIKIGEENYKLAFPVDTWVSKIAHKLGCNSKNIKEIKDCLIERCRRSRVNPPKVAAGLWYLGFHSLDVLLEDCLGRVEIRRR